MKKYFLAKKGNALSIAGTSLFLCARSLFYAVAKQSKFVKTTNFSPTFPPLFSVGLPPPEHFRPRSPATQKKAARRNGTAQKHGKVFCKATRR